MTSIRDNNLGTPDRLEAMEAAKRQAAFFRSSSASAANRNLQDQREPLPSAPLELGRVGALDATLPPGGGGWLKHPPIAEYRDLPHYLNALKRRLGAIHPSKAIPFLRARHVDTSDDDLVDVLDAVRWALDHDRSPTVTKAQAPRPEPTYLAPKPAPAPPTPPPQSAVEPQRVWRPLYEGTLSSSLMGTATIRPRRPVGIELADEPTGPGFFDAVASRLRGRWWLPLLLLLLLLLLLFLLLWAWRSYREGQVREFTTTAVLRMQSAPSYRGRGTETLRGPSTNQQVREDFSYVEPDKVKTRYVTTSGPKGSGTCDDREITVITDSRYQLCNDADATSKGFSGTWAKDGFNLAVLTTPIFQPWQRFSWCRSLDIGKDTVLVDGVPTTTYSCRIDTDRELGWMNSDTMKSVADPYILSEEGRRDFAKNGSVEIILWIRHTDEYVGRFRMTRVLPGPAGTTTQVTDYVYSDFGLVPSIRPPA